MISKQIHYYITKTNIISYFNYIKKYIIKKVGT